MSIQFPQGAELADLLSLQHASKLDDLFDKTLSAPLSSLFDRPKKNLRGQIVELGFRAAGGAAPEMVERACEIVEMLHAGSLVIDDIEDQSAERRGSPSLHKVIGVPLALNAGNWLYFLPFQRINELDAAEAEKSRLTRECFRTLLLAHYGQALDVGVPLRSLPQTRVPEVALSAMELKTGVLAGLALRMGSLLGGAGKLDDLEREGRRLGIALQMFDDIGNLTSHKNGQKRGEDFRCGRLNYLSSVAALELSAAEYTEYLSLIGEKNCDPSKIQDWLESRGVIASARRRSETYLTGAVQALRSRFKLDEAGDSLLENLRRKLMVSYD